MYSNARTKRKMVIEIRGQAATKKEKKLINFMVSNCNISLSDSLRVIEFIRYLEYSHKKVYESRRNNKNNKKIRS